LENTATNSTTPSGADPLADVVPFLDLPQHYPQFFAARHSAAWLLRQRDRNGLATIVRWIGRTAFVSRADFASWFRSRADRPASSATRVAASRLNLIGARQAKARRAATA